MRRLRRLLAATALLGGAATLALAKPVIVPKAPRPKRVPVATIEVVQGQVELADRNSRWRPIDPRKRLATGERLRTDEGSVALVRLPWMTLLMAPLTTLGISDPGVLSTSLEAGRLEQEGERGIVKLDAGAARIRGRGHVVVRRAAASTAVSVFAGAFSVEAGGATLTLPGGTGAVVDDAHGVTSVVLPLVAATLTPGVDPAYVPRGSDLVLSWEPAGQPAHVQVSGLDGRPLLLRDVTGPPLHVQTPDLGTFRWRVSLRNESGLEGPPSAYGSFCVVEK